MQTYALPLRPREGDGATLRDLGVLVAAPGAGSLDMLSITLVPRGAELPRATAASRSVTRERHDARTRSTRTRPRRLAGAGRRRPAAGWTSAFVPPGRQPVPYRVAAGAGGGHAASARGDASSDAGRLAAGLASTSPPGPGSGVELALEAESERAGRGRAVGRADRLGAARRADGEAARPNVIFYVIDGGGADLMSLYGYDRRTTPFLEQLARGGRRLRARLLQLHLDAALDGLAS